MHNEVTASIHANCSQYDTLENEENQYNEVSVHSDGVAALDHDYLVTMFTLDDPIIVIVSHISG